MSNNYSCRNHGCGYNSGYNSRSRSGCPCNQAYGSLSYLRSSCRNLLVNNCSCGNGCGSCGNNCNINCNGCSSGYNGFSNGCRHAQTDYPYLTGCSGSRIFYTGCCGCAENSCGNTGGCCNGCDNCNNCNGCNGCNDCNGCNGCDNCNSCNDCNCCQSGGCSACGDCGSCDCGSGWLFSDHGCAGAAEFIAVAPQSRCAGGAIAFNGECDTGGLFSSENDVIRINRDGRYLAIYSFADDSCDYGATTLSLAVNGNEIYASRAYVSHGMGYSSRSAMGQAVFCARAGDCLTLNTSVALNIPQTGRSCPLLTMVILKIN